MVLWLCGFHAGVGVSNGHRCSPVFPELTLRSAVRLPPALRVNELGSVTTAAWQGNLPFLQIYRCQGDSSALQLPPIQSGWCFMEFLSSAAVGGGGGGNGNRDVECLITSRINKGSS